MKPPAFTYHRPSTLEEALRVLDELGSGAKVLAGGQSLVPLMSMRLAAPAHLIDINHLPGLDFVEVTESAVRVGALARHARIEKDEAAYDALPLLRRALTNVAHPTIRNRGTTVGSLVHADPAAEMTAVLAVLDGVVEMQSARGAREVPAADFFVGPMECAVRTGELAVAARFPRPPAGSGTSFVELSRRHGDYAMCGVAAVLTRGGDAVTGARVGLICVGAGPVVVDLAGAIVAGRPDPGLVHDLVDAAIDPEADIHASADYRRQLAHVLVRRALDEAYGDTGLHRGAA
ncbi:MAG: FAD binding domain-containing protein [Nocardioidaceae bacterium]